MEVKATVVGDYTHSEKGISELFPHLYIAQKITEKKKDKKVRRKDKVQITRWRVNPPKPMGMRRAENAPIFMP